MSLKDMQTDLEVVSVQDVRFDGHPSCIYPAIYTRHGWKNTKTGEIKWQAVTIEPIGKAQEK
jgi:hypothetical protein